MEFRRQFAEVGSIFLSCDFEGLTSGCQMWLQGVVGLAAEFVPKVCSGHYPRRAGSCATDQAEFLAAWVPLVPVTSGVGADVVSSSPLILSMILGALECLGMDPHSF